MVIMVNVFLVNVNAIRDTKVYGVTFATRIMNGTMIIVIACRDAMIKVLVTAQC